MAKKAKASKAKPKPKMAKVKAKVMVKAKKVKAKPKKVSAIPKGYHTATAYMIIKGAAEAIEFYKKAFGATELVRMPGPDGKVMHAEIKIGDSPIMLADENMDMGTRGPKALGGTPVSMCLYVKDVDSLAAQAIAAGVIVQRPVTDQFYGDRSGTFGDPFGHVWTIATHKEDVSPQEMRKRMQAMMPPPAPPRPPEMHQHHDTHAPQPSGF
jgi:PhnB protein